MKIFFKHLVNKNCLIRGILFSLVIGTTLSLINQFDAIFYGPFAKTNLIQILITYCVPFLTSTFSSAMQARSDDLKKGLSN